MQQEVRHTFPGAMPFSIYTGFSSVARAGLEHARAKFILQLRGHSKHHGHFLL